MIAKVNGNTYRLDVAKTDEERRKGLQGVSELNSDSGMIFFHPEKKRHPYWMHNTLVPLTMIYLDDESNVVDVIHRKDTCSIKQTRPDKPSRIVIEVPYNESLDEIIGQKVELYKDEE